MPELKKIKKLFIAITLILLSVCACSKGQSSGTNDIAGLLNNYNSQHFQEKIFVHTDKSFYVCGEITWFKLYNVDAYLNKPINISKVAFVELLNADKKPVLQARVELNQGTGNGSFMLPFSLNSGVYILRAYTNWMKNFSPDHFFEIPITIVNTLKKLPPREKDSMAYAIQFFPEGGNLVSGLQSKVAFHAVGSDGKGIDCSGIILNQHNDSITSFQSLRFGMGNFSFTPAKDFTYRALIKTAAGKSITRDLPRVFKDGYVMKLSNPDKENIKVSVFCTNTSDVPVFLLVHTRQVIKKVELKKATAGVAEFIINKKELGEGISHFTIFDNTHQPVCERLYFQQPTKKLQIEITIPEQEYPLRKKVAVAINTQDKRLQATNANLSVAIFRIDSLQDMEEQDIQSYLWLSSELRGNIESPAYYFNSNDSQAEMELDNLMLTQGWSRFTWEKVLSNKKPVFRFLPEYEGPVITGTIRERFSGLPAKNIKAFLSVPGQKFVFKSCTSDEDGKLIFNLDKFYGSNEVIVQAWDKMKGLYDIELTTPFVNNYSTRKYPVFSISEKWREQLLSNSIGMQVENVFTEDKKLQVRFPGLADTSTFYGNPDKKYLLDDYTRFITMEEVMREYVAEVRVRKQEDKFTYQVRKSASTIYFDNAPLVLLDGLPVFDIAKLIAFDPLKIKKLELVTRKFFFGNDVFEGIVSYSTYQGNLAGFPLDPNTLVVDYPGLQLQREFYSPLYETSEQIESRVPDFRNVLYWSPDIKTNLSGHTRFNFYTSDRPGRYAVVVQGINAKGIAGSKTVFFTVAK